jgi:hypothetical protein
MNGKFIDAKSEQGKQISEINKICEKCNMDKIYNPNTKRCVSLKGSNAEKYKNEINYCKKYFDYKMLSVNGDIKVFENILNIKIPKKFVKNNKSFLIKDIFKSHIEHSKEKSFASKLNIKDVRYKKYINYLPALMYSIYQVLSINTEAREYLVSSILNILSNIKGGVLALYIKVCVEYLNTPYLVNILSHFSFSKFFVFITGILVVITNLPSRLMGNKYAVRRISDVALNEDPVLSNIKPLNQDTYKPVILDEAQKTIISKYNAYNYYDKTINLSKLGINTAEAADPNTKIAIGYDDYIQLPFVELFNRNGKKSYWIFSQENRKQKINEIKNKSESLIKELDSKIQSITDIRESHSAYLKTLRLRDTIQQSEEELSSVKKYTPIYNKSTKKLETLKKELEETDKYLQKKKYTPLDPNELKLLQPKLTHISHWKSTIANTYKYSNKLDNSNINIYYPTMMQTIDSATNFVKSIDQLNINVPQIPGQGTPLPTNVIQQNLNTINSQIITNTRSRIEEKFEIPNEARVEKDMAFLDNIIEKVKNDEKKTNTRSRLADKVGFKEEDNLMLSVLEEMGIPKKSKSPPNKTKLIKFEENLEDMAFLDNVINAVVNNKDNDQLGEKIKAFDTNPEKKIFKIRGKKSVTPPKKSESPRKKSGTPPKKSVTPPKKSATPPKKSVTPPKNKSI